MKTRYALLSTLLAAAIACGGPQQKSNDSKQQVYVETSSALTIADLATVEVSGVGAVVGAVGPFVLTYAPTTGKFSGNLFLSPDTYSLTLTARKADSSVIGTATTTGVVVTSTSVKSVSLNIGSIAEPLPAVGFVITGFAGDGYVATGGTANFSVTAVTAGAVPPTYLWAKSPPSCAGTFGTPTAASTTFTDAVQEVCTVTVTVTDGVNTALKATRSATIGVGVDVQIAGTFIPSPTITQVVLLGNGGYDGTWDMTRTPPVPRRVNEPACTLYRVDTVVGSTTFRASQTCTGLFKINSGLVAPLPVYVDPPGTPVLTLTAPQLEIGVTYDLGGIYDATKPPKVGVTASCPNATTNGVSLYSFDNVPANPIAGSGPGTATCPAAPAVCVGSANLWWTEPIAFSAPATGDLCTLTVTVNNQGALDSFPVRVFVTQ